MITIVLRLGYFLLALVFFMGFTGSDFLFLTSFLNDKVLHFLAFLIYPFITLFVFSKVKNIVFFIVLLFSFLSVAVEIIQREFTSRVFSELDMLYSIFGVLSFYIIVNLFKIFIKSGKS
jgi:hypothetical protein